MNSFFVVLIEYKEEKTKVVFPKTQFRSVAEMRKGLCEVYELKDENSKVEYFDPDFKEYIKISNLLHLPNMFRVRIKTIKKEKRQEKPISKELALNKSRRVKKSPPKEISNEDNPRESYMPEDEPSYYPLGNSSWRSTNTNKERPDMSASTTDIDDLKDLSDEKE